MLLAALIAGSLPTARADVPPGPFYVEDCTVEKLEQEGTTCEACGSWYGADSDTAAPSCDEQYAKTGFTYVCQTWGASAWTEVWCDGPPREGGCGCSADPTAGSWLGALGLVALAGRRRRG